MQSLNMATTSREDFGKGAARRLRRAGMTPCVIYRDGATPLDVAVDPTLLQLGFTRTGDRNTLVKLDVAGKEHICLVQEVQRHPAKRNILHVDFYEVRMEEEVVVKVKVVPEGRAAGEAVGGHVMVLRRTVDVRCLPADIPGQLSIDVSPLEVGDVVTVESLIAPKGATLLFESNFNLLVCEGARAELEAEEVVDEEDEEDEESAESDE
jgi:large subunit ribosomal protein L25